MINPVFCPEFCIIAGLERPAFLCPGQAASDKKKPPEGGWKVKQGGVKQSGQEPLDTQKTGCAWLYIRKLNST
jgi:hypothetical protein